MIRFTKQAIWYLAIWVNFSIPKLKFCKIAWLFIVSVSLVRVFFEEWEEIFSTYSGPWLVLILWPKGNVCGDIIARFRELSYWISIIVTVQRHMRVKPAGLRDVGCLGKPVSLPRPDFLDFFSLVPSTFVDWDKTMHIFLSQSFH